MNQIHKRIREKSRPIGRREAISASVLAYIRNNPEEYISVLDEVKKRRALSDGKFAVVRDDMKADLNSSMRLALVLPEKLINTLKTIIDMAGNKAFLEDKREYQWFCRTYPQFFIPKKL